MSTRSLLIAAEPGPEARVNYCHQDSHPHHLGKILAENYATANKVRDLMRRGDAIGISAKPKESIFFHRDRGRPITKRMFPSIREAIKDIKPDKDFDIEYVYLFQRNVWAFMTMDPNGLSEPVPVTPETITDNLAIIEEPEFHERMIKDLADGDPVLTERLMKRAQARLHAMKTANAPLVQQPMTGFS